jgi:hypothetical protein
MAKRKVPPGKAIRWSEGEGDPFLEMATPTEEEIEAAMAAILPSNRPLWEAPQREKSKIVGSS